MPMFFAEYPVAATGGGVTSLDGMTGALTLVAGANITIVDGAGTITISATGGGGADQALDNLTSPTAVNQDLIFATGADVTIKTQDEAISKGINFQTGDASGAASSAVGIKSGDAVAGATGGINLYTGVAGGGASGDLTLHTGSASTTRGNILFQNGSEGTAGQVWTSTGASGEGSWAAVTSPPPVVFRGVNTSGTALASATVTAIGFTAQYDTASGWDGNNTYTIPSTGYYKFHATLNYDATAYTVGAIISTYFQVGASVFAVGPIFTTETTNSQIHGSSSSAVVHCTAGDAVMLFGYNEAPGGSNLRTSSENNYFEITKIG